MATTLISGSTNIDLDAAIEALVAKYQAKVDAKPASAATYESQLQAKIDALYSKVEKFLAKVDAGKTASLNLGGGEVYKYVKNTTWDGEVQYNGETADVAPDAGDLLDIDGGSTGTDTSTGGGSSATYTLTADASSVSEGGTVTYTVTASASSTSATTFNYLVSGVTSGAATATGSTDFSALTGTVTLPAGATTVSFTVIPSNDSTTEGFEAYQVKLLNSSLATLATSGTVIVSDAVVEDSGQTFTLTTGIDGGTSFTGGSHEDTFDGSLSSGGTTTLGSGDSLNGGGGTDSLTAVIATTTAVSPTLTAIENLTLTATAAASLNLSKSTGYESIEVNSSTNTLSISNINDVGVDLKVAGQNQDVTFGFTSAAVAGSSDAVDLTIDAVTAGTITISGVETLNVKSSGADNTLTAITAADTTKFVITGDQKLNIGTFAAAVSSVDASALTSGLTATMGAAVNATVLGGTGADSLTISAVTNNVSVAAGDGNDTIISSNTNLTTSDTIDGGAGTADVLSTDMTAVNALDTATPTTYTITNVEQISISDALSGDAVVTNISSTVDTVNLTKTGGVLMTGSDDTITGGAGSFTVNLGGSAAGNTTGQLDGTFVISEAGGTATTDTLTLNNLAVNSTTGLNIDVFADKDVTSTGYESVTINTGTKTNSAAQTITTLTITSDAASANTSLTLTGKNAVDINAISTNSTGLLTVNASGLAAQAAGTYTLTIAGTTSGTAGTQSITGSDGEDTIAIGNFAATISGGAAKDTITGGSANDSIAGGAGNDTINTGNGNNTVDGGEGDDAITGGTGNDSLAGGSGNDTFSMGTNLTTNDTIDGGAGTNTLTITSSAFSTNAFTNITNIQNVAITGTNQVTLTTALSTSGASFDLSEAGVNKLKFDTGYTGDTTVLLTNATHNGTNADEITNTANVTLNVKGDVADFNTVVVSGGTGSDTLTMTADDGTASLTSTTAIETITVVAGSTATKDATITNAVVASGKTLTVDATALTNSGAAFNFSAKAGQAGAVVVNGGAGINTINVTNVAGGATVNGGSNDDVITGGTGNDSLSGGEGNDSYVMAGNLTNADTISDASGTADTLTATINALSSTTGALKISGVETITLATTGAASTVDATNITGASAINVGDAQNVTITKLAAGVAVGVGYGTGDAYTGTVNVSLADATGTADSLTVKVAASSTDDDVAATLVTTGIENVTINSLAATGGGTNDDYQLDVSGVTATTLTLTGSYSTEQADLTGTGAATLSTTTTTFDASGYSGIVNVLGSASATTFKLKGAVADVVTAGAANDTFTVSSLGTAAVDLDGAAGTDSLTVSDVTGALDFTNVANFESITLAIGAGVTATPSNFTGFNDSDVTSITITGGAVSGSTKSAFDFSGATEHTNLATFDASGYAGDLTMVYTADILDSSVTVKAGTGTSDSITASFDTDTAASAAPKVSGFETVKLASNVDDAGSKTMTYSLTNVTGATTIAFATGTANTDTVAVTGYDGSTTLQLGFAAGGAADTLFEVGTFSVTLASATGTADALNLKLADTNNAEGTNTITGTGIEVININAGASTSTENHTISLSGVATTSSAAQTINITGGMDNVTDGTLLTITNVNSSANVIAASGFIGSLVLSDRGSSAMTITSGTGADSLRMEHASDVIDAGTQTTGTGGDTLTVAMTGVGGALIVDLTSTGDQITMYNGLSNSAVQKGFENLDASGYNNSAGVDVTAVSTGSVITGSLQADVIALGAGADDVKLHQVAGVTGYDAISSFVSGTDDYLVATAIAVNGTPSATLVTVADVATWNGTNTSVTANAIFVEITASQAAGGVDTSSEVIALIGGATGDQTNITTGDSIFVFLDDGTDGYLWNWTDSATNAGQIDSGELTLVAKLVGVTDVADGDFAIY